MKVAIYGDIRYGILRQQELYGQGYQISAYISNDKALKVKFLQLNNGVTLPIYTLHVAKKLLHQRELDGVIIANRGYMHELHDVINTLNFNGIKPVGLLRPTPAYAKGELVYWLDPRKGFFWYLETHVHDTCNLKCKGCSHFSNLFTDNELCTPDIFARDMRELSQKFDIMTMKLLGGETLLTPNLDEYIEVARKSFPKTAIFLTTNGLLLPKISDRILRSLKDNNILVDISLYKPTEKLLPQIETLLREHGIMSRIGSRIEEFSKRMDLSGSREPEEGFSHCGMICTNLRNGKLYKCPMDAYLYKFKERYNRYDLPESANVDLFAADAIEEAKLLLDPIELCRYCGKPQNFPWKSGGVYPPWKTGCLTNRTDNYRYNEEKP